MTELTEAQSRDYDSGNYDAAYVSEDIESAPGRRLADVSRDQVTEPAAYTAGFYSSFELHEIADPEDRETVAAWRQLHPND